MSSLSQHIVPVWKRWLSYFQELHLESYPSDINPHLYVCLNRGRLQLCAKSAIYSFEDLYDNFHKTFSRIALPPDGSSVLVLGLGLGSVIEMLERNFKKSYHFTAVEIDDHVIQLADKYVLRHLQSPIQTICTDAYVFCESASEKYDLILVDVFINDLIPTKFSTSLFTGYLKDLLHPSGQIIINRLYQSDKDRDAFNDFYQGPVAEQFAEKDFFQIKGNRMIVASN